MNEEYWKFVESERHFNATQAEIRKQAATWILAAFGAIALLLKSEDKVNWLVSPAVLVVIVSVMATLGLLVLWINDQLVYQRLLDCGFIIALKMEFDDSRLPPVRAMMMYAAEGKGMARWMTHFYTIPMWGFVAISIGATLLRSGIGGDSRAVGAAQSLIPLIALCAVQLYATAWVQWKKAEVGAKARAALFADRDFAAMFEGTDDSRARFGDMIARHKPVKAEATESGK